MIAIEPKLYFCNTCGRSLDIYLDDHDGIKVQHCKWCYQSTAYCDTNNFVIWKGDEYNETNSSSNYKLVKELPPRKKNEFLESQRKRWQRHRARRGKKF